MARGCWLLVDVWSLTGQEVAEGSEDGESWSVVVGISQVGGFRCRERFVWPTPHGVAFGAETASNDDSGPEGENLTMIKLNRLNRTLVAINPDLVERIEETPDTVVTLTDGKKLLVVESIDDIVEMIICYRAEVSARSHVIDISRPPQADLHLVGDSGLSEADGGSARSSDPTQSDGASVAVVTPFDENGVL